MESADRGSLAGTGGGPVCAQRVDPGPLPANDEDIAFAPVTKLSRWIEQRKLTSERLTKIYLDAAGAVRSQAALRDHADARIGAGAGEAGGRGDRAGKYRGPLHGIPWGGKDLLDTAGIPTTYGAEPYRDRVPTGRCAVVKRLNEAGAVLVAKLSLGALALNDIWFGGQTMNPWLLEEGSSGSSAGPGAATAAGLVGFAIGSETGGSIVSPEHALRRHRAAADLRARAAHRRDDAVLVAGQAGADDARRGGCDAGAARDLRTRRGRPCQRAQQTRFRRDGAR